MENQAVAVNMTKLFMQTLVETIEKEYDSDCIIVQLDTLKNVIEELNLTFLTEAEVSSFSEKILNLLKNSDEKKQSCKGFLNEVDEGDEDEKEMIGEEIRQEEEVQVAISELIGIIFKTHKTMSLNLANYLISNILPSVFIEGQTENMLKFGIFIIDDMVEYLGYELLQAQWLHFGNALLKYTSEKSCVLRQASSYGLGILAKSTPTNVVTAEIVSHWLHALIESVKIPKGTEKEKTYGHCRDNGVASIGKILQFHSNHLDPTPYISFWISFLPLKNDKDEGIFQHELLVRKMLYLGGHHVGKARAGPGRRQGGKYEEGAGGVLRDCGEQEALQRVGGFEDKEPHPGDAKGSLLQRKDRGDLERPLPQAEGQPQLLHDPQAMITTPSSSTILHTLIQCSL